MLWVDVLFDQDSIFLIGSMSIVYELCRPLDKVLQEKKIFHDSKSSLNYSNHNVCYSFPLEAL